MCDLVGNGDRLVAAVKYFASVACVLASVQVLAIGPAAESEQRCQTAFDGVKPAQVTNGIRLDIPGFKAGKAWTAGSFYRSATVLASSDHVNGTEKPANQSRRDRRRRRAELTVRDDPEATTPIVAPVSLLAWNLPCDVGLPSHRIVSEQQIGIGADGSLELTEGWIRFPDSSNRLFKGIQAFGQFSLFVDITSTDKNQTGPARILSCSADTNQRNFTLGQKASEFVFRMRTCADDVNGTHRETQFGTVKPGKRQRIAVQYDGCVLRCSVDGSVVATRKLEVDFSSWQRFPVVAGNEATGDRTWRGHIHRLLMLPTADCSSGTPKESEFR